MNLTRTIAVLAALALVGAGGVTAQQAAPRPRAARTPHATAGKEDCLSCHGPSAREHVSSIPAEHNYPNARCLGCHRVATTLPPASQHANDARHAQCVSCHKAGGPADAKPAPESHSTYDPSICSLCHQPAQPGG